MRFQLCVLLPLIFTLCSCAHSGQQMKPKNYFEKLAKLQRKKNTRSVNREVHSILYPNQRKAKRSSKKSSLTEEALFLNVVSAYQEKSLAQLQLEVQAMQRTYPMGALVDNALYLLGDLYMQSKKYAQASKVLAEVIEKYPNASHRSVSLYKKGQAYEKLNLLDLAESAFKQIESEYPGSPESFLVKDELSLITAKRKRL